MCKRKGPVGQHDRTARNLDLRVARHGDADRLGDAQCAAMVTYKPRQGACPALQSGFRARSIPGPRPVWQGHCRAFWQVACREMQKVNRTTRAHPPAPLPGQPRIIPVGVQEYGSGIIRAWLARRVCVRSRQAVQIDRRTGAAEVTQTDSYQCRNNGFRG
jgi:hypothetical protein